jgi:hypothetical protein
MKFLDLINEDEQSEYDKVFKRTQTVFNAIRKGRIRRKDGVVFSYEIPKTNLHLSVSGGQTENPSGFILAERIYVKLESPECKGISHNLLGELIKRKFKHFDIQFSFNIYPQDIEEYNSEPINEVLDHQDEESTNLTDDQLKQLKRAKTVYKALKKGKATFNLASSFDEPDEHTIKYELGDPYYYWIYVSGTNTFRIEISKITVYIDDREFYERSISKEIIKSGYKTMEWILLHNIIAPRVRKRFGNSDIDIRIADADLKFEYVEPQPINENDNEKLLKKARTVYKAYKHGKYKNDNQGQREDALFSYRLSDDPTIQIVQYYIDHKTIGTKARIKCEIFIKCLNEVANWTKTDRMIKNIVNKFKNHDIDIDIQEWTYNTEPYTKPTEPINEDTSDDEKRIKRARTIYKALKKGLLNRGEYGSIKYLLPDEYKIYVRSIDDVLVIRVGEEGDDNHVKFFFNDDDGRGDRPTKPGPKHYNIFVDRIWEKYFNDFDIKLIC